MKIALIIIYLCGLIGILCGIVFLWTKFREKHFVPEIVENILGTILFIALSFGGYCIYNAANKEIIDEYKQTQYLWCLGSHRQDGAELTEDQCDYFTDVVNGKYTK